jgi:hypothetical protein
MKVQLLDQEKELNINIVHAKSLQEGMLSTTRRHYSD